MYNIYYIFCQVFIASGSVVKIYAEGELGYSVHGLDTEVLYKLLQFVQSKMAFLILSFFCSLSSMTSCKRLALL
jgi:hypothetical protein